MFLILFLLILAISYSHSQNIMYSLKGQFLAEKMVEEKALAYFDLYYMEGKWIIIDWGSGGSGEIILVDGKNSKRKRFADSIDAVLGSSMWKNKKIVGAYEYPSWTPHVFEFDPITESFTNLNPPKFLLASLNDVISLPSKQIIGSAFLGAFRTWIFYFNGDTLKLWVIFDWARGKLFEKSDTIIGIGSNPTGTGLVTKY
jgi:hypothetical protein